MSAKQEIHSGAEAHKKVLARYGAVDNPSLQAYVTRVGKALAAASDRPELDWHFTVVDSPEVNAFAQPDGYVYVTRGILAYLNSEAELAGILGHEIGEVAAHHAMGQQRASAGTRLETILGASMALGVNNEAGAAMPQNPAESWTAGYGRDDELEADRLGAEYLAKAGYNPQAMLKVISVLRDLESFDAKNVRYGVSEPNHYHVTFSRCPDNDARLKQVVDEAATNRVASPRHDDGDLLRVMNGVYFGDGPEQGVVRNSALLRERLGFAIQFPQGWKVQNQRDRVIATSLQQDAMMQLASGPKNSGTPLETLQKGLKLDPGARFESGSVNGFPSGFAAGSKAGKPLLAAAIDFDGKRYLVAGITQDGPAYQRNRDGIKSAISSFHAITASERQQARPFVIRIIHAQYAMTMAGLAAHSPLGPNAESYLRLMNDLYPDGEPRPGQLLKVVD
ncbi:MAG: M48 family metalloprotease [Thiobacillaceae bacterium]